MVTSDEQASRRAFLLAFTDAVRDLANAYQIQAVASRLLGLRLKANRVVYCEITDHEAIVSADYVDGVRSMSGRYPLDAWGDAHVASWQRGGATAVQDVLATPHLSDAARANWQNIEVAAYIGVTLVKGGRLVAALGVHSSTPRRWTEDEVELAVEVADRTWAAVERAHAEDALRRSEALLRAVVDNSGDGINMLELQTQRYVYMSPAQVELTGFTADELNGLPAEEAYARVHPDDVHISIEQQRRAAAGLEPSGSPVEYRWKVKSGEYRWFSDNRRLVRDEEGRPVALVGVSRDITARKALERALRDSEERYAAMFEASPFAMSLTRTSDDKIVSVNPAFLRLFGFARQDVLGKTVVELGISEPEERERVLKEFATQGAVRELECRRFGKSGEELVLSLNLDRVVLQGEEHVLTTIRDLTSLRRAEEAARLYERSRERLLDLDAMERLHKVSTIFLREEGPREVLDAMLEAAIAITEADFGTIQTLDSRCTSLRIFSHRGVPPAWVEYWSRVEEGRGACGAALRRNERVVIEDIRESDVYTPEALAMQLEVGIRAVQATPLVARSGKIIGIIATHYAAPRKPSERALRLLDLLARQAADILERTQAEAALRQSEAKYAGILDNIADAVISIDERRLIREWNKGAERMFGYSRGEAIGASMDILVPERHRAAHREHLAQFESNPARPVLEPMAVGRRKSGEEFPVSLTISKLEIDGSRMMIAAVRDVTAQRRREQEQRVLAEIGAALARQGDEAQLSDVLRISVRAITDFALLFATDEGGALRRVAAVSSDPTLQWCADVLMDLQHQPPRSHPVWQVFATRTSRLHELSPELYESMAQSPEHLRALHAGKPKSALLVPLLVGDACIGVLGFSSASRTLDHADLRLAEEIARRCAFFIENVRLHRAAQRALRARDEVLGVVAHDLRNPLNTVAVATEALRRAPGQPERRKEKSLDAIARASARMRRLVQDLLDVTRMEAGELPLKRARLSVSQVLAEVVESQAIHVSGGAVDLRLELSGRVPDVWADDDRLQQMFENLVGNALKFTTRGGITIGATSRGHEVLFRVTDTGAGIPANAVPHVFDRFWRARENPRDGAGLGLAIVKGIVEAHGGRIWVESRPSEGSSFFFTIPTADAHQAESAEHLEDAGSDASSEPRFARVLVAEDDADQRASLVHLLESCGYEVIGVTNGAEALDCLRTGPLPTAAIIDIAMPEADGWTFLEERCRRPELHDLPVIVVSGQSGIEERVAAKHASYIPKPIETDRLLAMMESLERG